jgi:hypothetical protein
VQLPETETHILGLKEIAITKKENPNSWLLTGISGFPFIGIG